jgi:hypothetical protein
VSPEGMRLRDAVLSWPERPGLKTSDLLDVEPLLRGALLAVLRRGSTTDAALAEALAVPEPDAHAIAEALVDRGALVPAEDGSWSLRRNPSVRPRPASRRLTDLLDGLVDELPRGADPGSP